MSIASVTRRYLLRYSCATAIILAITGCSYSYPIDVKFMNGKIAFLADDYGSGCLNHLEVASATGEIMWQFEGSYSVPGCRSVFPILYGKPPLSATSSTRAKTLLPDIRYYITASDGDSYYGSFRLKRLITIDSAPEEARNRPYPNSEMDGVDGMEEVVENGR